MTTRTLKNWGLREMPYSGYRLFHHFYLFSTASIIIILIVTGLGLRHVLRNLVIIEAEDDAIRVSTAARDCEIRRYIGQHYDKNERFLTIPPTELSEVDHHMRVFIAPFDIVKIKIFNTELRVIYSTDPKAIGKLDPNNTSLLTALAGTPISKYECKDEVWDLDDEERTNVEVVETYVPMYGTNGKVIGSFEVYKDITRKLAMADKIFVRSWGALAVTALGVFATLMFVIHRAVQMIKISTVNLMATNEQLQQEAEDRKRLEKELLSISERERQRIGQELHDSIGQQLTGIAFMMEVLGDKLSDKSLSEQVSYAEKINARVSQATEQTHNLARGLHPIDLDRNGLVSALHELKANTEQLFEVSCTLKCEKAASINDVPVAINLYRIAQEAITNAIKHGKAKKIMIELTSKNGGLTLTVENDGLDFLAGPSHSEGMGLKIMRYRAEIINSSFDIHKGTNGGTIVTCVLPSEENP
ncbi:MAG: sensor histidine kinase [Planctomycetota bacterium]|jgi:signal transduction histidine kinase